MVAVADDNQILAAVFGQVHDDFGGVSGAAFAGDVQAVPLRRFRHFLFAFREIIGGGVVFSSGFAGQIRMARQRLPYPQGSPLGVTVFGGNGGAFQRGLAAFRSVITHQLKSANSIASLQIPGNGLAGHASNCLNGARPGETFYVVTRRRLG